MSYKVKTTPGFEKSAKAIAKKHKSIKSDLAKLIDNLEHNLPLEPILVRTFIK